MSGESAGLCYWGDHERSKHTFHGDTVRTGDLFVRDADGFYWYRGRADDLLKVGRHLGGARSRSRTACSRHPAVAEGAVVGYEEGGLTLPAAFVVLRDGHEAEAARAAGLRSLGALTAQVPARRPLRRRVAQDGVGEGRPEVAREPSGARA